MADAITAAIQRINGGVLGKWPQCLRHRG